MMQNATLGDMGYAEPSCHLCHFLRFSEITHFFTQSYGGKDGKEVDSVGRNDQPDTGLGV